MTRLEANIRSGYPRLVVSAPGRAGRERATPHRRGPPCPAWDDPPVAPASTASGPGSPWAPSELSARPDRGRVFSEPVRAGLGDTAPSGRVRLDALARWLQDAARADLDDAGPLPEWLWVVRRTRLRVERFPRWGEACSVATWCSGLGAMWAERRTTVTGAAGGRVEAVALWVALQPGGLRPQPLSDAFTAVYGEAAAGRRVRARLRHPAPPPGAAETTWRFRASDLDMAGHVNNAAYWQLLEEELPGASEPAAVDAEIEFRAGTQAGDARVLADGPMRWVLTAGGELGASARIGPPPDGPCRAPFTAR